ncbi:MAG TPA: glycosyltransferase [Flavobacterium sp.]|jgi:uncharacterized protein (TIGR00661 family)
METQPTSTSRRILVAPLNWGLGHAARCIPVIKALEDYGFLPILASDGAALELLRKEFPHLESLELPSYEIEYPKKGENFKWKMLSKTPVIIEAVLNEKRIVKRWIKEFGLAGIISDNRLGVVSKKIPSVFITHQLNVLSGTTSWLSGGLHRRIIEKFTECWVPDTEGIVNLSGRLGHLKKTKLNIKYIGPLSRLKKEELPLKYDLMVILSGPEPQRTVLEKLLFRQLSDYEGKIVFIKGTPEAKQQTQQRGNMTIYNFMTSETLNQTFNESEMVVCRSGYSTLMDLVKLEKKALLIPTPGQYEQEYLARKCKSEGLLPCAPQEKFKLENLLEIPLYKGLPILSFEACWKERFALFERE